MIPVMALDVSLTATGYATTVTLLSGAQERRFGVIRPPKGCRGPARLDHLAHHIARHIRASEAKIVAIENYAFGAKGRAVTALPELGGCIRRDLWKAKVPYIEVSSNSIKAYATGRGNAHKNAMVEAANDRLRWRGQDHNVADAMWLHALTMDALGQGYVDELGWPAGRAKAREAIAKVVPLLPADGLLARAAP